ncbi:MAG TPA: hypothetical protein DEH78_28895 [Solibacterales bacterium]|nr:hypothetical protein [Bryobacterales bacterium]
MSETAPITGIDKLYLFPYFSTREEYRAAMGKEAPPYKPYKPRKHWLDPKAAENTRRYVTYERALVYAADGRPMAGPDQRPVIDELVLPKEEAGEVNLPPDADAAARALPEVAVPMRALESFERIEFAFGGALVVKNVILLEQMQSGFGETDRALLRAIARKLDIAA